VSTLLQAALWSGVATLVLLVIARFWRRDDGALWHEVWVAVALASAALPALDVLLPNTVTAFVTDRGASSAVTSWIRAATVSSWVAGVYFAGFAWALIRLASGVLLVRRLCRRSEAVEGFLLDRIQACVDVPAGLVRTHPRAQVPITAGWITPVILLPTTWVLWDFDRLRVVLRHELAHVERSDYRWNLFALCFEAMFWFSPLARIVSRRLRLSAELAADRSASDRMDRVSYARILVESAREVLIARRRGMVAPGAVTALEARVAALTSRPDDAEPSSARTRAMAAVAVLALILAGAFIRIESVPSGFTADHVATHKATHGLGFKH